MKLLSCFTLATAIAALKLKSQVGHYKLYDYIDSLDDTQDGNLSMEGVEMFFGLLISHDLLKLPAEESKHLLEPFQAGLPTDEE